jgi:hypothetical protein
MLVLMVCCEKDKHSISGTSAGEPRQSAFTTSANTTFLVLEDDNLEKASASVMVLPFRYWILKLSIRLPTSNISFPSAWLTGRITAIKER